MLTKHIPAILVTFVAIALITILAIGKNAIQINRQGDAAIFEQLIENISAGKGFNSNVFANTQSFLETKQFKITTEELIASQISAPEQQDRNMLGFHAYYVLAPLSLLHPLVSSSLLLIFVQTSCFFGLLLAAYFFVKKSTGNYSAAILLALFIALNPNWFIGIMGQFYPDRIFVLAGFLLFIPLYYNAKPQHLLIALIFTALINERAGLIAGMIICAHSCLLFQREHIKRSATGIIIGALGVAYFYCQKNYLLENAYYNKFMPHDLAEIIERLRLPHFTENIIINLENNSPLLLLSLFAPRYLLITFAIMLPNIIGKVGGGEKIGWLTHYHSYYFPVLVFSATVGFINLFNYAQGSRLKGIRLAWAPCIIGALLLNYIMQNTYKINHAEIAPNTGTNEYILSFIDYVNGRPTGLDLRETIQEKVSKEDIVATTELGMALLHNKTKIHVFPIGLSTATKIFVSCPLLEQKFQEESIGNKLRDLGFTAVENIDDSTFAAISYCLLERKQTLQPTINTQTQ